MSEEDLKATAEKEVDRVDHIIELLDVVDERGMSLLSVLQSYHTDARGFIENGKWLQAIEAAFICWAYVDAGLHLGVFNVPDNMRDIFTA